MEIQEKRKGSRLKKVAGKDGRVSGKDGDMVKKTGKWAKGRKSSRKGLRILCSFHEIISPKQENLSNIGIDNEKKRLYNKKW